MSYAIIRNVKYKMANLQSISRHNERQNENYGNKDIDVEKSNLNYHLKQPQEKSYEREFERLRKENNLKGNLRLTGKKQSNVACEFLITSDKEFFQSMGHEGTKKYFEDAYRFACDKCGEKNIISTTVHMDETTPHMHLTYIPVVEGLRKGEKVNKINASEFWKGFNSYGKLQDEFYEHCKSRGYNLERGEIKEDKAKHLTVKELKLETKKQEIEKQEKENIEKFKSIEYVAQTLSKSEEHIKGTINRLQGVKAKPQRFSQNLSISQEDYSVLVSAAKKGEGKLLENMQLKAELGSLKEERKEDKSEIKNLVAENKDLRYKNMQLKRENNELNKAFSRAEKAIQNLDMVNEVNNEIKNILNKEKSYDIER